MPGTSKPTGDKRSKSTPTGIAVLDELVVKLDGAAHAEAIVLPGATLFDPSGTRPMKQWVQLPAAHRGRWLEFVRLACEGTA